MMPRAKWLSRVCLNTNANWRTQFTNGNNQILYDFVFISGKHYCTTVKKKSNLLFIKLHLLMLTNVGILINLLTAQNLFFKAKQTSMGNECGLKGKCFCTTFTLNNYSQMYYNALFCMTIFRLDWTVSHVNWILFFRSFI